MPSKEAPYAYPTHLLPYGYSLSIAPSQTFSVEIRASATAIPSNPIDKTAFAIVTLVGTLMIVWLLSCTLYMCTRHRIHGYLRQRAAKQKSAITSSTSHRAVPTLTNPDTFFADIEKAARMLELDKTRSQSSSAYSPPSSYTPMSPPSPPPMHLFRWSRSGHQETPRELTDGTITRSMINREQGRGDAEAERGPHMPWNKRLSRRISNAWQFPIRVSLIPSFYGRPWGYDPSLEMDQSPSQSSAKSMTPIVEVPAILSPKPIRLADTSPSFTDIAYSKEPRRTILVSPFSSPNPSSAPVPSITLETSTPPTSSVFLQMLVPAEEEETPVADGGGGAVVGTAAAGERNQGLQRSPSTELTRTTSSASSRKAALEANGHIMDNGRF